LVGDAHFDATDQLRRRDVEDPCQAEDGGEGWDVASALKQADVGVVIATVEAQSTRNIASRRDQRCFL
jgi:hypothetical protein